MKNAGLLFDVDKTIQVVVCDWTDCAHLAIAHCIRQNRLECP